MVFHETLQLYCSYVRIKHRILFTVIIDIHADEYTRVIKKKIKLDLFWFYVIRYKKSECSFRRFIAEWVSMQCHRREYQALTHIWRLRNIYMGNWEIACYSFMRALINSTWRIVLLCSHVTRWWCSTVILLKTIDNDVDFIITFNRFLTTLQISPFIVVSLLN